MRQYRKKKRSSGTTKVILFLASLVATAGFGLITPNENTSWMIVPAFCVSLQMTLIMIAIALPSAPDPRELTHKSIFRGWLLPEEEDEERERQRENDRLGFEAPDMKPPTQRR